MEEFSDRFVAFARSLAEDDPNEIQSALAGMDFGDTRTKEEPRERQGDDFYDGEEEAGGFVGDAPEKSAESVEVVAREDGNRHPAEVEAQTLRDHVVVADARVLALEEEVSHLRDMLRSEKSRREGLESSENMLREVLERTEYDLESLQSDRVDLEKRIVDLEREKEELERRVETLEVEARAGLDRALEGLRLEHAHVLERVERDCARLRSDLRSVEEERNEAVRLREHVEEEAKRSVAVELARARSRIREESEKAQQAAVREWEARRVAARALVSVLEGISLQKISEETKMKLQYAATELGLTPDERERIQIDSKIESPKKQTSSPSSIDSLLVDFIKSETNS